jgi:hypothetical protein
VPGRLQLFPQPVLMGCLARCRHVLNDDSPACGADMRTQQT